jgi:uncharacterized protein YbjT (DUF2867 family)
MTTQTEQNGATSQSLILITGGTGKTGRRVAERLQQRGLPVRIGSRSGQPPFDWNDASTWPPAVQGARAIYLTYYPDVAIPGSAELINEFSALARQSGVQQIVLLSGRGEEEAQRAEQVVQASGLEWTVVRASWFAQNFSENFWLDAVLSGEIYLPVGDIGEPFVDADDIADVAALALSEAGHHGQVYEVTGPRLLTFAEAIAEIAQATGRDLRFVQITPEEYVAAMEAEGVPADVIWLVNYLFTTVLDGRNASLSDGVERALGRPPKDFADYARETAATGVWNAPALTAR